MNKEKGEVMTERERVDIPESDAFLLAGKSANVALRKRKRGKLFYSLFVPTQGGFSVSSLYAVSEGRAIEKAVKRLNRDKDRGLL